jgi:hypothetical protein
MTSITLITCGLALALALSATAMSSTACHAFSAEAQQMCSGDAFRLCGSEIPDIAGIIVCMRAQRAHLSTGCGAVMDKDDAAARSTVAAR